MKCPQCAFDNPEGINFCGECGNKLEKVLYHEIGHHRHQHNFGTDPDQEKEADRYSGSIMKISHSFLLAFIIMFSQFGFKSTINYYRWGL